MTHLVVLTPGFPENEADTSCIPALQIYLRHLVEATAMKVSVIAFQYPFITKTYWWHGVKIHPLGGKNQRIKKKWVHWQARRVFAGINREHRVTQLHSFWLGECARIAEVLAQRWSIPHLCTAMGQDVLPSNRFFRRPSTTTRIITLSQFHRQQLMDYHQMDSDIVYWGLDQRHLPRMEKSVDVIGVGSLIGLKRFAFFVDIIRSLVDYFPTLRCVLVGDGPLSAEISNQIEMLGLAQHIELKGRLDREATLKLMAQARVLLHPSRFESFGMVLIEALAMSTYVASTPVGLGAERREVACFEEKDDFVRQIRNWLEMDRQPEPTIFSIQDTVEKYLNHYQGIP